MIHTVVCLRWSFWQLHNRINSSSLHPPLSTRVMASNIYNIKGDGKRLPGVDPVQMVRRQGTKGQQQSPWMDNMSTICCYTSTTVRKGLIIANTSTSQTATCSHQCKLLSGSAGSSFLRAAPRIISATYIGGRNLLLNSSQWQNTTPNGFSLHPRATKCPNIPDSNNSLHFIHPTTGVHTQGLPPQHVHPKMQPWSSTTELTLVMASGDYISFVYTIVTTCLQIRFRIYSQCTWAGGHGKDPAVWRSSLLNPSFMSGGLDRLISKEAGEV